MPTTRKSTAAARGRTGPTKGQSTISFSSRVTKAIPKDAKAAVLASAPAKADIPAKPDVEDENAEEVAEETAEDEPEIGDVQEVVLRAKAPEKTEAELKAEVLTDAHINKYWKSIEKERKAPRVHQKELTISEKILRYFDVSSQYGPCIGMPRMKRWQRAERLGLNPPIEVLSVLLRENKDDNPNFETAEMDKIMNSTVVEA